MLALLLAVVVALVALTGATGACGAMGAGEAADAGEVYDADGGECTPYASLCALCGIGSGSAWGDAGTGGGSVRAASGSKSVRKTCVYPSIPSISTRRLI